TFHTSSRRTIYTPHSPNGFRVPKRESPQYNFFGPFFGGGGLFSGPAMLLSTSKLTPSFFIFGRGGRGSSSDEDEDDRGGDEEKVISDLLSFSLPHSTPSKRNSK